MLALLLPLLTAAQAHDLRVDMLDVGQGDSILIRDDQRVILIDAGDDPRDVARQLKAEQITKINLVIATHPHADHVGGMLEVVTQFPVTNYVDNHQPHTTATYTNLLAAIHAKEAEGLHWLQPGTGDADDQVHQVRIGPDATLTFLFPLDGERETGTRSDLNSNSVVARIDHGKDCFLFVGDAEAETERALLNNGLAQCDVLKVAHHGSEYATTPAFLAAVQPKIALISVGAGNRYGHPGPKTVGRIESAGAKVYRTDLSGRITVRSTGEGVSVTTEREAGEAPMAAAEPPPRVAAPSAISRPGGMIPTREPEYAERTTPPPLPGTAVASAEPAASATPGAAPAEQATEPAAEACPFPASRNSEVFHEDGCGNGEKISPANLVCYPTRDAAIAAGKRPAGCCKP